MHMASASLPETASLSSVPYFAECFLSDARQRGYLSSVREKALGKQLALGKEVVCRVPSTQQTITLGKTGFADCYSPDTRQRAAAINPLPSVFFWHSAKWWFAEWNFLTLGKAVICRVPFFDTRQTIFFSLLTSKLFLQSSYNTWCSMFQCGTFLGLFLYFFNLFHLIEFSWIIQIITDSHSNNKKNEWKNNIHVFSIMWGRIQDQTTNFEHML